MPLALEAFERSVDEGLAVLAWVRESPCLDGCVTAFDRVLLAESVFAPPDG
jgi:hypothetical protein